MKPDVGEALRYLGVPQPAEDMRREAERLADELSTEIQPRYVYRVFGLEHLPNSVRVQGANVDLSGSSARTMLKKCNQAALLACTLGARFDAKLLSIQARDMAKAVIFDALGSALVEAGCGHAEREISGRFPDLHLTDRFSPGYGDLPLAIQPQLCAALDAGRRLGLTVSQSLLMIPVKSVTAVIGLSDSPQPARIRGCACCNLRETCTVRKGGSTCAL